MHVNFFEGVSQIQALFAMQNQKTQKEININTTALQHREMKLPGHIHSIHVHRMEMHT